jgi:hypothetical protein
MKIGINFRLEPPAELNFKGVHYTAQHVIFLTSLVYVSVTSNRNKLYVPDYVCTSVTVKDILLILQNSQFAVENRTGVLYTATFYRIMTTAKNNKISIDW